MDIKVRSIQAWHSRRTPMAWRSHRECPLVVLEVTPPRVQRILRRAQRTPPRVRRTRPRAQRTRPRVQPTRPRVQRTRPRARLTRPRVQRTPQRVQRTRQRITRQRKKTKTTSKSKARGARLFSSNPEITSPHAYQTPIHFHPSIIARTGIDGDGGDVRLHAQSPSALAQICNDELSTTHSLPSVQNSNGRNIVASSIFDFKCIV